MPDDDFILPPLEREKHDELEVQDWREAGIKAGHTRTRVKWERRDSLLVYYHLGHLGRGDTSDSRLEAAMRFRLDWYASGREPKVTMRYAPFIDSAGAPEEWHDIKRRANKRYEKAALALARKGLLTLVIEVACQGQFTARGRMGRLTQGLDMLAKHA